MDDLEELLVELKQRRGTADVEVAITQVRDRVTTVATTVSFPTKAFTGFGSSVCDTHDEPNSQLGEQLALGRSLKELGQKLTRDAWLRAR